MKKPHFTHVLFVFAFSFLVFHCSEDEVLKVEPEITIRATSADSDCSACTYVVPSHTGTQVVDGRALGIKPGNVVCLSASNQYKNIIFRNIEGTAASPVVIRNCGGTVNIDATGLPFNLKTENSKHFIISGGSGTAYGIRLNGGHMGLTLEKLSSNFEVHNLEIYKSGFAGIIAKTDPTCDDATIRGNFVMRDVSIHHNYVHDTGGEGLYVGNSFYEKGRELSCGTRYPHIIDGLKIYSNKVINPGWEAIQVGCALFGAYVYNNTVENYGAKNVVYQNNGIQFSEGSKGICYGNMIKKGNGIGINIVGYGDSFVHNNVIIGSGSFGIFCDERTTRNLPGFRIIGNTIISPATDGLRMYNEYVPGVVFNNIIVNPGNYDFYTYPRTADDSYVYKLGKTIPLQVANNLFTRDINEVKFIDHVTSNYRLASNSPALNIGKDISNYSIALDFYGQPRLSGTAYDIGASEYNDTSKDSESSGNIAPVANAGPNKNITLPIASFTIVGSASDADGSITSYSWSKRSGGAVTMNGTSTKELKISNMVAGSYVFVLTVTDNEGATHSDAMLVNVTSSTLQAPVANAGPNKVLYLPENSTTINGSASDADGTITSYAWSKKSGGVVTMRNITSKDLAVSGMVAGSYVFVLTVTDNNGLSHSDGMLMTVK